ncbi:hypothetical protein Celaphus_00015801 [Cervus elaphus hippelaphus]|uniref:Uncharacterized protein n=1 Tax=Cervus elaphus hippelaphus TaxID=46360 RepID=A0A212C214_CEREH|nr:hypothetical protein Celaphus_00015801 [Cervus elaphus hippelaphus]
MFIHLLLLPSSAAASVLLTVILIIVIAALAAFGFFHYRKTGSILPSLPKLSRSVSLCGILSLEICLHGIILFILHQNEHFATDFGKPPIIFENPTYTSKDTAITAAQPTSAPVRNHSPF